MPKRVRHDTGIMETQELISRYFPLIRKHWFPLSLGILGMTFFAYGLIGLFSASKTSSEDIVFEANSTNTKQTEVKTILVDVEGAVVKPGVYKLPQESRIQDAFVAAGGLSATADREQVAKNFNLAIKLTDGAKIYVPLVGQAVNGAAVLNATNTSSEGIVVGTLININTASQEQLETLPEIGQSRARGIIEGRPYGSIDELLSKKIIGAAVFDQIKDKVSVY